MKIASIPAGENFLAILADWVQRDAAQTQTPLTDYQILLPTRRAVRTLGQYFFPINNAATLLPRIHAIGDLDEDVLTLQSPDLELPPAISPMARLGLLIYLIREQEDMPWQRALALAKALTKLLDESILRGVSLLELKPEVTAEVARHWEKSAAWLRIIAERWPEMLMQRGQIDAADLRQRILKSYANLWRDNPPQTPIIAAGSTGSLPGTRGLLRVISNLPRGQVILPALDTDMPNDIWETLPEYHPQNAMRNLLAEFQITRPQVKIFGTAASPHKALWQEVLLPPEATARWRDPKRRLIKNEDATMLQNLHTCTAPTGEAEANAISMILYDALSHQKSAALVTPDRALAQRVSAKLERYGILANDSAGQTLSQSAPGRWLRLLLKCTLHSGGMAECFDLLRHPYSCFSTARDVCRTATRQMESDIFHQTHAPVDIASLLAAHPDLPLAEAFQFLLTAPSSATLAEWMAWLRSATEKLAAPTLWQDDAGESLQDWLLQLETHSDAFGPMRADDFEMLCEAELESTTLHPRSTHPQLHILGPLESRLHAFDVVVLSSLNEGTWPAEMSPDPWLSRQMRKDIALGLPDEHMGLAAHDFMQMATQPHVYLTRAQMQGSTPTLPSRWWQRLSAYLQACGLAENVLEDSAWLTRAEAQDAAPHFAPANRPMPTPTVRPRKYSASSLRTLIRNPYEFYAQKILHLRDLPELLAPPKEKDQGEIFHALLAEFTDTYPKTMPRNSHEILDAMAEKALTLPSLSVMEREFWWQNYLTARDHFLAWQEAALDAGRHVVKTEFKTKIEISSQLMTAHGEVILHAKADRLDVNAEGEWVIVDYKRNHPPSKSEMLSLHEPQLVMEGWLLTAAPLEGYPVRRVATGEIWPLLGDKITLVPPMEFQTAVDTFASNITPFLEKYLAIENAYAASAAKPEFDSDKLYQQLARTSEWKGHAA